MAAEFKIGRLRYNWEGTWTSGISYARDSVVQYQGQAYTCLVPNTASQNFYSDLYASPYPYWSLMIVGHTWAGTWYTGTLYSLNNLVIYNSTVYVCNTTHTSTNFASNSANWSVYVQNESWGGTWQTNTAYGLGILVSYGGIVYECTNAHTSASTISAGLEANQSSWTVQYQGVAYLGQWTPSYRYKLNDLVTVNSSVYICVSPHTSESPIFTGSGNWSLWLSGQDFKLFWTNQAVYQIGDAILYGGNAYISTIADNQNNIPSLLSGWSLFNVGYSSQGAWNSGTVYSIGSMVTRNGMLYEATATNVDQDPSAYTINVNYTSAGSSGTTLVVSSTSGIIPGMIVSGAGLTQGQVVSSVSNNTTIILDRSPDGTLTGGQSLSFIGANSTYWNVLVPSKKWNNQWASNVSYVIGDIVARTNTTYSCIKSHTSTNVNRPDLDTNFVYWTVLVAHDRNNSMTTYGDLESFNNGQYQPIPIGTQTYNLRVNSNTPNWQQINVVPGVYYVDTVSGVDDYSYGITWDKPWKTIQYACTVVGQGLYYPLSTALLQANKSWMITEMYQWMLYQMNNNISPFSPTSVWDPFYAQRDAGYIIDAVIYDMQRGGNSQTVAATLRWFYYGSQTILANQIIESAIAYFAPPLNYLMTLMECVVNQQSPPQSYQTLNGITPSSGAYINQVITLSVSRATATSELNVIPEITSLMNIPITALTNQNTYLVPASNTGLTAIINIKTGTYNESLPIVVPENVSIVGDELRSVAVQPATSIQIYATSTNASTDIVTVTNTVGLVDQMPLQFISPYANNANTSFDENINPGQTYYVLGTSITGNGFQILNAPTLSFVATAVLGSNILYNVSKIAGLVAGMTVTGTGIPDNTTVVSFSQVISGISTVTISKNATVSAISQTFGASGSVVSLAGGVGNMLIYAGDCLKDMWLMTNGTTMRNLTNWGLLGMLSQTDAYGIARPTGGNYTSLNPGTGPDDTSVWIIRRSPYIQNVTNFGTGCGGAVVDGNLHNGGTKAMLHNDYTQVLSDGIGVWIRGSGAISECVSVFSYYAYIGHFAEAGGRVRSTNGNSSYGTFGVVSHGYDVNEIPATGTIFNQSIQVQAAVESAFGTADQLLKLNYSNAGSAYYLPSTNMLQYSNLFTSPVWSNDGNVSFIKNEIAPSGYTEAWLLTGSKNTAGSGYIQQSVNINPAGYFYSAVSGVTQNGAAGNSATFDVTVTNTAYTATVHSGSPGSLYQVGNTILILGSRLGGLDGINDLVITVGSLTGTGINSISSAVGTVPAGSSQSYTLSLFVYPGTSSTIDIQGVFSGNTTVVSGISYNVSSNVVTPYAGTSLISSTNAGMMPVYYGAEKTLVSGWYRVWLTVNDSIGLNNVLTFKFFPQGANAPLANTYSIIYGSQLELSGTTPPPDFYLETTTGMFTAYANYQVVGAGSGVQLAGEEVRSRSVFNARITTDSNGYTGGTGYVTSSNNAQGGTINSIQLSQAELGVSNYVGMRIFINEGTGAGQYGYISYFNGKSVTVNGIPSKTALVVQEEFESMSIIAATYSNTPANNTLTIDSGTDLSKLYINQPVQFIPTFYTATISSTSIGSVIATATVGGTTNTIAVPTAELQLNMPVVFSGTGFNLTSGYIYYIVNIDYDNQLIQVSNVIYGNPVELSTVTGNMTMTFPNYSEYLYSNSTASMTPNFPIQFTGYSLGGVTLGTTYYIGDIVDSNNFTISSQLVSLTSTSSIGGSTNTIQATTTGLIPLNPVVFGGTMFDASITANTTYYISNIVDSGNFQITSTIIRTTASATQYGTNLITLGTITGFVVNQPIVFSGIAPGTTFGNIVPETVYYIQTINNSTGQITISASISGGIAGSAFVLTTNSGLFFARTCPTPNILGGGTGSMSVTSTGTRIAVTHSVASTNSMNATFSTSVFGGLNSYTIYYVTSINTVTPSITISTTLAGTPVTLTTGSGVMQMCASGWDNINPGTPPATNLNTSSGYFIEPRTVFSAPANGQTLGTVTTPLLTGSWQSIAYGNNYFIAVPNTGSAGATSTDGLTWSSLILPSSITSWTNITFGNFYWIALGTTGGGTSVAAYSNSNGLGWRWTNMPSNATWNQICYGNGIFVAIATGTNKAAYSNNFGATWSASSTGLLATNTWVSLSYGSGLFLAVASNGTGSWSYDGNTWQATQLPQSTINLSGVTISGSLGTFSFTTSTSNLIVGQSVVISGTNTGSGSVTNGTYYIIATNGSTNFTLGATPSSGTGISTGAGTPVGLTFAVGAPNYTAATFGNNRFIAVQNGTGLYAAYSFNGITWYQSLTYLSADLIAYGQGAFVSVQTTGSVGYKTDSGLYWKTRTLTYGNINCISFGYNTSNVGIFPTLSGTGSTPGNANGVFDGVKAQGRVTVTSTIITAVSLWETGSNYIVAPTVSFIDYNVSVNALVTARIGNGTLSNPTFVNRGTGYNTTSTVVTIRGNGYADSYQTGYTLIINNLSSLPVVGSNLTIAGNSQVYKVTSATAVYGTSAPFIEANVQVSPSMTNALSPANGTPVSLRTLYSQVRLTNHDFLAIGTGNKESTNYPYVDETTALPYNEAVEVNQGHVFYTSTDENGNFLVGGLFGVEQATGTVTLSATQFGLQGLQTLSLGGIAVGGQSVIVTQFSTDAAFVANSDTIIPTQRAVKAYLTGRLSQGGANTYTGSLIAGSLLVGGSKYIKSTIPNGSTGSVVKMKNKVYINATGVDGNMAALDFFMRNSNYRS